MANKSAKVTVQELPAAPAAIEGVSTSTMATAGWTPRGRTDMIVRCGSFAEYSLKLGGFWSKSYVPYAVNGFYENDGKSALVRRITPADAVASEITIGDAATAAVFVGRPHAAQTVALANTKIEVKVDAFAVTELELLQAPVASALQNDVSGPDTFSDQTTNANSAGAGDVVVFPATEAIGDYFAVGFAAPFNKLILDSTGGTAGVDGVVAWEYWNGTAWTALSGVTDGSTGFTAAAGSQNLTFTLPTDWATTSLNAGAQLYYVRARVTTVFTTNPVYSRVYVSYQTPYALSFLAASINALLKVVNASLASTVTVVPQTTVAGTRYRLKFTSPSTGAASAVIFSAPASADATFELLGISTADYAIATAPATNLGLAAASSRFVVTALGAGLWGDDLRLTIGGDPNFKTATGGWSKFDVSVEEELDGDGKFSARENYGLVVLDNDTDSAFLPDFVTERSSYVAIEEGVDFGVPRDLQPATHLKEFLGDAAGDGVLTTFTGRLLHLPNRKNVTVTATIATVGAVSVTDNGSGSFSGAGVSAGTIDYTTGEISITFTYAVVDDTAVRVTYTSTPASEKTYDLAGGDDGTGPLTRALVTTPTLAATKAGVYAFNDITDEVLNLILPDFAGVLEVHNDLIAWAEARKDVFVILDPAAGLSDENVVKYVRDDGAFNTSYAALYWPWVKVPDNVTDGAKKNVPPSGHVAGVYARTDSNRNVAKAPAGTTDGKLNGTLGYERTVSEAMRDTVYPARVNPLIGERQTGRCVWGARTLSLDKRWKYVQARRFFMFVEKSTYVNSWWTVFETIGPDLFARIKTSLNGFLRGLLLAGYFPTRNASDAYAVIVDSTNNSEENADAGEVIIDVFLAPSKPGEFIQFRFRQKIAAASA